MIKILQLAILMLLAAACVAQEAVKDKIIPVSQWPRVIYLPGKQVINPSADQCIKAGYRLLSPAEKIPEGKYILSETIEQDPDNADKAIVVRVYEDIPVKPKPEPIEPPVITNVTADKVIFKFTTNGVYRGIEWLDAPVTNAVK